MNFFDELMKFGKLKTCQSCKHSKPSVDERIYCPINFKILSPHASCDKYKEKS